MRPRVGVPGEQHRPVSADHVQWNHASRASSPFSPSSTGSCSSFPIDFHSLIYWWIFFAIFVYFCCKKTFPSPIYNFLIKNKVQHRYIILYLFFLFTNTYRNKPPSRGEYYYKGSTNSGGRTNSEGRSILIWCIFSFIDPRYS
jgi:hypothetical protein